MTAQPNDASDRVELLSDDELVALFQRCSKGRSPAERNAAVRAWHVLIARHQDRIVGWVATFRFEEGGDVVVAPGDREDVVQQAYERCLAKLEKTFRGTTAAEFRAALKQCVRYACMDHCRREMRREMGLASSIDETVGTADGDELGRLDDEIARIAARIESGRFDAALTIDAVSRVLGDLANEDMKIVIRLTMEGYSSKEIAAAIGKSVANVDQLRSRGMRELRRRISRDE